MNFTNGGYTHIHSQLLTSSCVGTDTCMHQVLITDPCGRWLISEEYTEWQEKNTDGKGNPKTIGKDIFYTNICFCMTVTSRALLPRVCSNALCGSSILTLIVAYRMLSLRRLSRELIAFDLRVIPFRIPRSINAPTRPTRNSGCCCLSGENSVKSGTHCSNVRTLAAVSSQTRLL